MDRIPEIQDFEPPEFQDITVSTREPIHRPVLFGRERELHQIADLLDAAENSGHGQLAFLSGAAGTGKTAIATSAMADAETRGFVVVQTPCEPFHAGISLYPIKELMRKLTSGASITSFVTSAFGSSSYEAGIAKSLEAEDADSNIGREYTMATFANVVIGRAKLSGHPVFLFLDDLERIDAASSDAVLVLMSRIVDEPVILLCAFRNDIVDADPDHPARALLTKGSRQFGANAIERVSPVPREWLGKMVEEFLGAPCDADEFFIDRLMTETEGNPLFVREVLNSLICSQGSGSPAALVEANGRWHLTHATETQWAIPKSIEDAIEWSLRPLRDAEREVLNYASVIGRQFRYETLMSLSQKSDDVLMVLLDRLIQLDIIDELSGSDSVFQFAHGKVRDVIYSELSGLRRTRIHSQIAEILQEQQNLFPVEKWEYIVGLHLYLARKYDAASPYLENAGRSNLSMQIARDAVDAFHKCVDSLEKSNTPEARKLAEVRLLLGESLKTSGKLEAAMREFEQVLRHETEAPHAARWARNHIGDVFRMKDQVDLALRSYAECEEAATAAADDALLAENAADLAELHMRQYERLVGLDPERATEHEELYKRYLSVETTLAEGSADPLVKARSYRNQAKFERSRGNPERAIELYELSIASDSNDVHSHRFLIPYAKALRLVGRDDDAERAVREVLNWSMQLGALPSQGIARQYLGLLLMESLDRGHQENADVSENELRRALVIHQDVGFSQGVRETLVNLFELALRTGKRDEAISWLRQTGALTERTILPDKTLAMAVVAQLRANGEVERAARIEQKLSQLLAGT